MRKLFLVGLSALCTTLPTMARPLPAPIIIRGERPTTASLRAEMLEENVPLYLQKQPEMKLNYLQNTRFNTVYDRITRTATYYDGHLLQDLNRTDNPYGHNQPGFGINF